MDVVLHIITGLNDGGAEGALYRLCKCNSNIKNIVVSLTDEGKYGLKLKELGVDVHCLFISSNPTSLLKGSYQLYKLLKLISPNIVQTWMYHADMIGGIIAKLSGVDNIFWGIRNTELNKSYSKKSTILIAKVCSKLTFLPKKIICCASAAKFSHSKFGYNDNKLIVIPNGYELNKFKPSLAARHSIRREFDINQNEFLFGTVGRFHPQKDHGNLLQSIKVLVDNNVKFKCLFVGKEMDNSNVELKNQIKKLGIQDKIILAGSRNDIPAIMNALDLHVLPSMTEGFPNVIAEAMACGTPCISTDVGDSKFIIGDTGWIVPARNSKLLYEGIKNAVIIKQNSNIKWNHLKSASRERILNNFTIDEMVDQFNKVWTKYS